MNINPFRRFRQAMRNRHDRRFDRMHGIDTCDSVAIADLDLPDAGADHHPYDPTCVDDFSRIVRHLKVDPARFTLVDIGSGKGRILILAEEAGFARVIGVEGDARLCQIARDNVACWRRGRTGPDRIEIVQADARAFDYPGGDLVIFFYNSFGGTLLDEVIATWATLARDQDRRLVIAYHNHLFADRIDATGMFDRRDLRPLIPWRKPTTSIYRSKSPATA